MYRAVMFAVQVVISCYVCCLVLILTLFIYTIVNWQKVKGCRKKTVIPCNSHAPAYKQGKIMIRLVAVQLLLGTMNVEWKTLEWICCYPECWAGLVGQLPAVLPLPGPHLSLHAPPLPTTRQFTQSFDWILTGISSLFSLSLSLSLSLSVCLSLSVSLSLSLYLSIYLSIYLSLSPSLGAYQPGIVLALAK